MPADNSMMSTLLMLAVMALAFWFLLIRPAQRRQKTQQEMISKLAPGSRVVTTAGVLGTLRHAGERQVIVEISPGVEMTILKQAIMRVIEPSEEDFEYDDDAAIDAVDEDVVVEDVVVDDAPAARGVDEAPTDVVDPTDRPGEPGRRLA